MDRTSTGVSQTVSQGILAVAIALGCLASTADAAIGLTGGLYTQDFDTLAISGTSSTVPAGWALAESGTNANATYTAGTGSGTAGDTYSFGAAASLERAFGGLQSGTLIPTIGAEFANSIVGNTITSILIEYAGEQWRLGALSRVDRLDFQYSLDATSLATGTWSDVDPLDFTAPITGGTVGALDGNSAANRTSISGTIPGLSILPGATFWIRWTDLNASGSDDGLAVDDFHLTPTSVPGAVPEATTWLVWVTLCGIVLVGWKLNRGPLRTR